MASLLVRHGVGVDVSDVALEDAADVRSRYTLERAHKADGHRHRCAGVGARLENNGRPTFTRLREGRVRPILVDRRGAGAISSGRQGRSGGAVS